MPARKPNRSPESMAKRIAYSDAWQREHYDRIVLQVPKGRKDVYKQLAARRATSMSGLIVGLLDRELAELKKEDAP